MPNANVILTLILMLSIVLAQLRNPLGDDCLVNQYLALNDADTNGVQIPFDVTTASDHAVNIHNLPSFLELAQTQVGQAWDDFLGSICNSKPQAGKEWAGNCRIYVSKLRDKLCIYSALYPGRGGQYSYDPWNVVQEDIAHKGYYLTGTYLDMFDVSGDDDARTTQFGLIKDWYNDWRNTAGSKGTHEIWNAKNNPSWNQYVKLSGPVEKDGSLPNNNSPYQSRPVIEQYWGYSHTAKGKYGAYENLGYLFRIVMESAMGENNERWDLLMSSNNLCAQNEDGEYHIHEEYHAFRKQVRAAWRNLQESPEMMPLAWFTLTINSTRVALWDKDSMISLTIEGHNVVKDLFDNDEKHWNYFRSWNWPEEVMYFAITMALTGYYHIDVSEATTHISVDQMKSQTKWDLVERFGWINDLFMAYYYGVQSGTKDAAWELEKRTEINNLWAALKIWLNHNDIGNRLSRVLDYLPDTSCKVAPPTSSPTISQSSSTESGNSSSISDHTSSSSSGIDPNYGKRIKPITSLKDIIPPPLQYPMILPSISSDNSKPFAGKHALFVLSHGAEAHEVYYQHQYLSSRGTVVHFACPYILQNNSEAVLFDFYKPVYLVKCIDISIINFEQYDVLFVPGGNPSSSEIRVHRSFPKEMHTFWSSPSNKNKLLALLGTGVETLIESGILKELEDIVGPDESKWSLIKGIEAVGKPATDFLCCNSSSQFITYPTDGKHAHLLLGRNPNASIDFVLEIGKIWGNLTEQYPDDKTGTKIDINNDGYYANSAFIIPTIKDLPAPSIPLATEKSHVIRSKLKQGATVSIALASGITAETVLYLFSYYEEGGAKVQFLCPADAMEREKGKVYLQSVPPVQVTHKVLCDYGFVDLLSGDIMPGSVLVVPNGLLGVNRVLRNDEDLIRLIQLYTSRGGIVGFYDSALSLLIPLGFPIQDPLPFVLYDEMDLKNAGYTLSPFNEPRAMASLITKPIRDLEGLYDNYNFSEAQLDSWFDTQPEAPGTIVLGNDLPLFVKAIDNAYSQPHSSNNILKPNNMLSVVAIVVSILIIICLGIILYFCKYRRKTRQLNIGDKADYLYVPQ